MSYKRMKNVLKMKRLMSEYAKNVKPDILELFKMPSAQYGYSAKHAIGAHFINTYEAKLKKLAIICNGIKLKLTKSESIELVYNISKDGEFDTDPHYLLHSIMNIHNDTEKLRIEIPKDCTACLHHMLVGNNVKERFDDIIYNADGSITLLVGNVNILADFLTHMGLITEPKDDSIIYYRSHEFIKFKDSLDILMNDTKSNISIKIHSGLGIFGSDSLYLISKDTSDNDLGNILNILNHGYHYGVGCEMLLMNVTKEIRDRIHSWVVKDLGVSYINLYNSNNVLIEFNNKSNVNSILKSSFYNIGGGYNSIDVLRVKSIYSCDCGMLVGKDHHKEICQVCDSYVAFRATDRTIGTLEQMSKNTAFNDDFDYKMMNGDFQTIINDPYKIDPSMFTEEQLKSMGLDSNGKSTSYDNAVETDTMISLSKLKELYGDDVINHKITGYYPNAEAKLLLDDNSIKKPFNHTFKINDGNKIKGIPIKKSKVIAGHGSRTKQLIKSGKKELLLDEDKSAGLSNIKRDGE